ncbi:MAG: pyruvate carboxylase subunit B [SAR86 cluster bacterium]|uniref:Pyruvate carboxylase subunit B n=1 Tax=SAR86 cluster bacterium TaxID=2030880 RepID=A0A520MZU0_9GAMM|nr:MAG: pyruvate carboxylase subunit B [SAR86 cluster bacterium]
MPSKKPKITEVVLRDGQQSLIATRMKTEDMLPVLSKLDKVGYSSLEVWGGATYDCCLRFLNENPWDRLKVFKKNFKKTKLQMLLRGKNLVGYKEYDDSVIELFIKNAAKEGINIFRIFDALNDIDNIKSSIEFVNNEKENSQGTICYTTSPVHNEKYWIKLAKDIEDIGAKSLAIKDMAGLLRPNVGYELIKKLKKNLKIPIHLHTHSTTGLADATNLKAYEAGVDNIDTSISSFSNLYAHTATESFISMIYKDDENPFDMNLLTNIAEHFQSVRPKYVQYEGSMRGVDINMLLYQVPGGMLSILEKQLVDLNKQHRLKDLIDEIPRIREDVGFVPLVTPSSQIVGAQALMNVLDGERYKTLNKEFVDLVNGKYGKIPGKINSKLLKKIDKNISDNELENMTINEYRKDFSNFCKLNNIKDFSKKDTDLLNYILFNKESKDFYLSSNKNTYNDIVGLQEGFGLYIE